MRNFLDRKLSLEWIADKLWPIGWMLFGGYATAAYVGALEIFKNYKSASFVILFIIGAFVFILMYFLTNKVRIQRISIKSAQLALDDSLTNPLETRFENKVIRLPEFYDPFYVGHKDKSFINCRIEGPGLLFIPDSSIFGSEFRHCQIVIIKEKQMLYGVTVLRQCSISRGTICNCTLLMTRENYDLLEELHGNVPIISE